MPIVRLVHGDLFAGAADMVVLPCSTAGTVTRMVAKRLEEFALPQPGAMSLGDVRVLPLEDADQVAQFAAFAASVAGYTSDLDAVRRIGRALGEATSEKRSVRSISAALLGAGAGGLRAEDVVRSLRAGFEESAAEDALLSIFVLHREVYDALVGAYQSEVDRPPSVPQEDRTIHRTPPTWTRADRADVTSFGSAPPRVFISYTAGGEDRKAWSIGCTSSCASMA